MNLEWVTERIALGSAIGSPADIDKLVSEGVTHVLNMREVQDVLDPRLTTLWLSQLDDGSPRPPGQYPKAVDFAFTAFATMKPKVYCHCQAGMNRGPTVCYALLRAFGMSKQESVTRIIAHRPWVTFYARPNYIMSVEQQLGLEKENGTNASNS